MALFIFTKALIKGEKIIIFNNGNMIRDFNYVDYFVQAVNKLVFIQPQRNEEYDKLQNDPSSSWAQFEINNIAILIQFHL